MLYEYRGRKLETRMPRAPPDRDIDSDVYVLVALVISESQNANLCYVFSEPPKFHWKLCEWLRMLGWRGFTNPRRKIAKFKKLRSSFCVLQSRITDYKKQLQFSARLDFDDQDSSLITRLLGLLKHY